MHEEGLKMYINYIEVDRNEIDIIQPLWEKLRNYHHDLSPHFAEKYNEITFQERKRELLKKSMGGSLRVEIAKDEDTEWFVGYCVSSICDKNVGEIDSIYLEDDYRSLGIGNTLMENALNWMDENGVKNKKIVVAVGNEKLISFYEKFDFLPGHIILENKNKE